MVKILVTGGAGYIGSQTVFDLTEQGFEVVVLDSLIKNNGLFLPENVRLEQVSLLDFTGVKEVFAKYKFQVVIHFAAYIEVGESQNMPLEYYENNFIGTFNLLRAMNESGVKNIVFSSTAAVYGLVNQELITEDLPKQPINVYGRTKSMMEDVMVDFCNAYNFSAIFLRYFNASGADLLARTGENHNPETHLIPSILFTLLGKKDHFTLFGTDYNTPDGTCIRDYIHTVDLASAHILAMKKLLASEGGWWQAINLGTGNGYSVKEIICKIEEITGKTIPIVYGERRYGDPDRLVASNNKAQEILGWQPTSNLDKIIQTAWNWHKQ